MNNGYLAVLPSVMMPRRTVKPIDANFVAFGWWGRENRSPRSTRCTRLAWLQLFICDVEIELGRIQDDVALGDAVEVVLPKRERFQRAAEDHGVGDIRARSANDCRMIVRVASSCATLVVSSSSIRLL